MGLLSPNNNIFSKYKRIEMTNKTVKKIGSNYYLYVDGIPDAKLNEIGYIIAKR